MEEGAEGFVARNFHDRIRSRGLDNDEKIQKSLFLSQRACERESVGKTRTVPRNPVDTPTNSIYTRVCYATAFSAGSLLKYPSEYM